MIKNKKIKILTISILCVLTITIGLSYGYYLLNKVQENNNIVGSKCFNLEFTNEKNAINLDNMYPISDEEGRKLTPYSFTITNTCDMLAGYTVNMEMLEGTTLNSKYLDGMVNNEEIKLLSTYEETDTVINGSIEARILAKGTLAYNDSVDYTVRFWMDKDVEDIDSMNKYFASKIVINATPSSWNPKDAGYDTLHDAILANEYQTTAEDAISKIEAKGEPDLSQTAPSIKWVEKIGENTTLNVIKPALSAVKSDDQSSDLTEDDVKITLYKSKKLNNKTGKFVLNDAVVVDPTTLNFDSNQKYYFAAESIYYVEGNKKMYSSSSREGITIYQVVGASKSLGYNSWNGKSYECIIYKLDLISITSVELEVDKSDKGLYQAIDDYGTTYYYRGNVKNNNVHFSGFYWQIVRINGDGSIRLIYNGTEKKSTDIKRSIDKKVFMFNNVNELSPAYVGYMYGNPKGTTFDGLHTNTNSSTIKLIVDNWYRVNVENQGYSKYLSRLAGFCGDRSLSFGDGISTLNNSDFGAYKRYEKNIAQFTCPEPNRDLYTTIDSSTGNKALTYPVGLITYDELVFSGMNHNSINKLVWSYSSQHYWTMTPSHVDALWDTVLVWHQNSTGTLQNGWATSYNLGVRPVINLKSDVKISNGTGTVNNPYIIDTN